MLRMLYSYSSCNMYSVDDIVNTITNIIVSLGAIGTFIIGVITLVNLLKYIQKKRADSIFGFYSRLRWDLKLLLKTIGLYTERQDKDSSKDEYYPVNVLYAFSENSELRANVTQSQMKEFENYRKEIIELLCRNDNQVSLDDEKFEADLEKLFIFLTKYKGILDLEVNKCFVFTKETSDTHIDGVNKEIKKVINDLITFITNAINETK